QLDVDSGPPQTAGISISLGKQDELSLLTALLENEPALACDLKESNPLPREDGKPDVFDEVFDAAESTNLTVFIKIAADSSGEVKSPCGPLKEKKVQRIQELACFSCRA
ncbi:Protein MCM10, partial [Manis javanica]